MSDDPTQPVRPEEGVNERDARAEADAQSGVSLERGEALGRYLILGQLGAGGQGVVLAAYDPELDRKLAIKLLRKDASGALGSDGQMRLLREAQAMARLNHPNVIAVHDVGTIGDQVFVAMEFVDGPNLKKWLKEKPRTWREVLAVYLDAGRGLAAAHAAGLVHRDFKPDNVLIGSDGRVRVTDFGLARLVRDGPEPQGPPGDGDEDGGQPNKEVSSASASMSAASSALSTQLTQVGVIVGTLNYMSPEQFLGLRADSRSDQFSYCAALYRALWGKRPFDPDKLRGAALELDLAQEGEDARQTVELRGRRGPKAAPPRAPKRSPVEEPPGDVRVPAWLRKAILKGLSLEPADRFPSMDALLSELGRDRAKLRWRWAGAAGVLLAIAGAALGYREASRGRAELCRGAERKLAGIWDASTSAQIDSAFQATKVAYANDASRAVAPVLDRYAQGWVRMHRDACEATRLRGEQSEELMQRRMVCLERRLKDMAALVRVFVAADPTVVQRAVDAAQALPSLSPCADAVALTSKATPGDDPALRARIEALSDRLSEVKALYAAGKFKGALEIAQVLAPEAEKARYEPLSSEVLHSLGWLQQMNGDAKSAEATLVRSVVAAEQGRDDYTRALSGTKLVYTVGFSLARVDQADVWASLTAAVLNRLGGDGELEADLQVARGSVYLAAHRYPDAKAAFERALGLLDAAGNPEHPKRALLLANLGRTYSRLGEYQKGVQVVGESLRLAEKVKGPHHPALAYPHYALGQMYTEMGDYEQALSHAREATRIWSETEGPEHPDVADAYNNEGTIYQRWGKYPEALDAYGRALRIDEKALGPEDPVLAWSLDGMGQVLLAMGKAEQALPHLKRAMALWGDDASGQGMTGFALAKAAWAARHDAAWARGLATAAKDAYARAGKKDEAAQVAGWIDRTLRR